MGRVLISARKVLLVQRKNNIQNKLMEIARRVHNLHLYSSKVANDGMITLDEMAGMPMMCRAMANNYARYGHGSAIGLVEGPNGAMVEGRDRQTGRRMGALGDADDLLDEALLKRNLDEEQKARYWNLFFKKALKERLEEAKNAEKDRLKCIEDELDQERLELQTQLDATKSELEGLEQAEKDEIKNSTPKYA